MTQQAGWYDDPEDGDKLRYWDGVQWTDRTSPKQNPNVAASGQADSGWGQAPGSGEQQPSQPNYGSSQQQGGSEPADPYGSQSQGQWSAAPMPGGGDYRPERSERDFTPDGQPLAGWWHRVGARIIDLIVLAIVTALAVFLIMPSEFFSNYADWLLNNDEPFASPPGELAGQIMTTVIISGVITLLYEIVLTAQLGGTLGKLATGLRVRLREEPGNVSYGTSAIRGAIYQGPGILSQLYAALGFLGLFSLINVLWPLWDGKRQAIHDKVAKTNVVKKSKA